MASEIKLFPTLALPEPIDLPVGSDKKPLKNLSKYKVGVFNTQDSVRNSDLPGEFLKQAYNYSPSINSASVYMKVFSKFQNLRLTLASERRRPVIEPL